MDLRIYGKRSSARLRAYRQDRKVKTQAGRRHLTSSASAIPLLSASLLSGDSAVPDNEEIPIRPLILDIKGKPILPFLKPFAPEIVLVRV